MSVQVVHASHFPLGAALMYKSGHGNQYQVGRVLKVSSEGKLLLGSTVDQPECEVDATSEDLLPLGIYSENISIVINQGTLMLLVG